MILEHLLNFFELGRLLVCRLNPQSHFARLRIKQVTSGTLGKASRKYAVLVISGSEKLHPFTMSIIDAFNRADFNLVVVSNGKLDALAKASVINNCCLFIERLNIGRDFGGYKDAISLLLERFDSVDRLVIANDSVYYFDNNIDGLVQQLAGAEDFIGVSEVFHHAYHVSSFLLSFSHRVVESNQFRKFWSSYLPISTRMWTIMSGEISLTECLTAAGYHPKVLFRAEDLYGKLCVLERDQFTDLIMLLPKRMRRELMHLVELCLRGRIEVGKLAETVVSLIKERNQLHAANFLFMKYLGLPLLKRDIVYRQLFSLQDVERAMDIVCQALPPEVAKDLVRRRPPSRLNVIRWMLYKHDYI